MTTQIIDGKAVSAKVKDEVREGVSAIAASGKRIPALAVILVGEDPASQVYVRNKIKDCTEVGIESRQSILPASTTEKELLALIASLNADPSVDGILVQLPLPKQIDEHRIIEAIDPSKDVDAFHPVNAGKILLGLDCFAPCTPSGVMRMLEEYGIDPSGKRAVVIGRSNIVGKPMALLLLQKSATVTVCHSRTHNLAELTREADILVVAIGKAKFVDASMIKPGAVVIDVGMNRDENGKLCGDVDTASCTGKASAITPVPGGVGPMTRAMLMKNTLRARLGHAD